MERSCAPPSPSKVRALPSFARTRCAWDGDRRASNVDETPTSFVHAEEGEGHRASLQRNCGITHAWKKSAHRQGGTRNMGIGGVFELEAGVRPRKGQRARPDSERDGLSFTGDPPGQRVDPDIGAVVNALRQERRDGGKLDAKGLGIRNGNEWRPRIDGTAGISSYGKTRRREHRSPPIVRTSEVDDERGSPSSSHRSSGIESPVALSEGSDRRIQAEEAGL